MANDPLAQYRKAPATSAASALPPKLLDEYEAFGAKDKVRCLRIRSRTAPVNAVVYNILLNVVYDEDGTHFILVYTILTVLVRGKNLQTVVFAIENGLADFIQEFDSLRWAKSNDASAPVIEAIEIKPREGSPAQPPTKH